MAVLRWPDGFTREYKVTGESFLELSRLRKGGLPIMAAVADGRYRDLQTPAAGTGFVHFYDISSRIGLRTYRRSLTFLLIVAAKRTFPGCRIHVGHSLSDGLYCEISQSNGKIENAGLQALAAEMRRLVAADLPIVRLSLPRAEAVQLLAVEGGNEKIKLLEELGSSKVTLYSIDGAIGYFYGLMAPRTGCLDIFELRPYAVGFVLRYPTVASPNAITTWREQGKLYQVYAEAGRWGAVLECEYVSDLNQHIRSGNGGNIVRIAEALHEKKTAEIADRIAREGSRYRLILIAGPSSSGKTTFAQRLYVQLRTSGLRPLPLSLDDYFVDRDKTPRDSTGKFNFESLEAVNLELFNNHLLALMTGEEVELPRFDFLSGRSTNSGRRIRLSEEQPLIIEGIHGLNERLTGMIADYLKFRIYVCPLTQISLDGHNRVPGTDIRLLRRIVRDAAARGYDATRTLQSWPSVRRGEEENILPFQDRADVVFNSALIYELAVLKDKAEQALKAVPAHEAERAEALRLMSLLKYFNPFPADAVPYNSIVREFIGGSCFR